VAESIRQRWRWSLSCLRGSTASISAVTDFAPYCAHARIIVGGRGAVKCVRTHIPTCCCYVQNISQYCEPSRETQPRRLCHTQVAPEASHAPRIDGCRGVA